jgi:hypothetical protein
MLLAPSRNYNSVVQRAVGVSTRWFVTRAGSANDGGASAHGDMANFFPLLHITPRRPRSRPSPSHWRHLLAFSRTWPRKGACPSHPWP